VLFGDTNVGKTTVQFQAIMGHAPDKAKLKPTIAGRKAHYSTYIDGQSVALTLWDTAGQENYRALTPAYIRGAAVVVYVYSIMDPATLASINDWATLVQDTCTVRGQVLLANKVDLVVQDGERIPSEEGMAMADKIGAAYFEVSGVTGYGITDAMTEIARLAAARARSDEHLILREEKVGVTACCR
jgi:small GTP-binding protein